MNRRFYNDLGGRCKPVNNEFRSQYEREGLKLKVIEAVGFIAGVGIAICLTALALYLSRP